MFGGWQRGATGSTDGGGSPGVSRIVPPGSGRGLAGARSSGGGGKARVSIRGVWGREKAQSSTGTAPLHTEQHEPQGE